jgi:hypothetical protein
MISFCSKCSGWLLTLTYKPKFCASCDSGGGRGGGRLDDVLIRRKTFAVIE